MRRQFFVATVTTISLLALTACGTGTESSGTRTRNAVGSIAPAATVLAGEVVASTSTFAWATPPTNPYDYVIAGMGDSFGSGEGNPAKKKTYALTWRTTRWWNADGTTDPEAAADCHRSSQSGFYKSVRRLKNMYPHINFIYKNFACTGAKIQDIYRDGYVPPTEQNTQDTDGWSKETSYRSQLDQVDEWLREKMPTRSQAHLDALYLSIGGNDAGFATAITHCVVVRCTVNTNEIEELRGEIYAHLRDKYETLNRKFQDPDRYANTQHVVISEYPNFVKNENGEWCESNDVPLSRVSSAEWEYLWGQIGDPLLRFINRAGDLYGWSVASMEDRFKYNVLCDSNEEENAWINNDEFAQDNQGNDMTGGSGIALSMGMVHPNNAGYEAYADAITPKLKSQILKSSSAPGTVTNFRASYVSMTRNSAGQVQMKFTWTVPTQRGTGRTKRSGFRIVASGPSADYTQTFELGEGNSFTTWINPQNQTFKIAPCGQILNRSNHRGCENYSTAS
ncbi:MAG: hypothetical protein RLZ67_472 [Actinomycetota bacterium]|jgi:lysophospholipase L1-like esterase